MGQRRRETEDAGECARREADRSGSIESIASRESSSHDKAASQELKGQRGADSGVRGQESQAEPKELSPRVDVNSSAHVTIYAHAVTMLCNP